MVEEDIWRILDEAREYLEERNGQEYSLEDYL